MFLQRVAGPSRLPYKAAVRQACQQTRAYAAPASTGESTGDEVADRDSKAAFAREKQLWASEQGYNQWKRSEGAQYRDVEKGRKARWLGGDVPYASNPSFRPPPPISNKLQDTVYASLKTRTVGQVSEQHNISKARIEAIRKLKQVEDEFKRQGLQLQEAFQQGMEPLLGVRFTPEEHASIAVESEEEARFLDGKGAGGAFGDKSQQASEGIERTAWEFREEGFVPPSEEEQASVNHVGDGKSASRGKGKGKDKVLKPAKTVFRFVDTSS